MNFVKSSILILATSLLFTLYLLRPFQTTDTISQPETVNTVEPDKQLLTLPFGKEILTIRNISRYNSPKAIKMLESLKARDVLTLNPMYQAYYLMSMVNVMLNQEQPDDVIKYTSKLETLAKSNNLNWLLADALTQKAINETKAGKLTSASQLLDQAMALAQSSNYQSLYIKIYNTYGIINNIKGDYTNAQKYFHQGLKYIEKYPDSLFHSKIISNLALIYIYFEEWDKALEYIDKAALIYAQSKVVNPPVLAVLYANTTYVYVKMGSLNAATEALEKTKTQVALSPTLRLKMILLQAQSEVLYLAGDFQQGLAVAQACTEYKGIQNVPLQQALCYKNLGLFQMKFEENDAAIDSFKQAMAGFELLSNQAYLTLSNLYLSQAYEAVGNIEQALKHLKIYYQKNEKTLFDRRQSELYQVETAFNMKQSKQDLALSKAENELNSIRLQKQEIMVRIVIALTLITVLTLLFAIKKNRDIKKKNAILRSSNTDLAKLSYQDPLTGLYNRRFFYHYLKLIKNSDENYTNRHFILAIFDLDHFKSVNDNYGHDAGDQVLVELAQRISSVMGESDLLVRWGGEEFICLLEHTEKYTIWQQLEAKLFSHTRTAIHTLKGDLNVTISVGGITHISIPSLIAHHEQLLSKADKLLYQAKLDGRNQAKIKKRGESFTSL